MREFIFIFSISLHLMSLKLLQFIINQNALPCLLNLLTHNHKKSIKKEACWTISNITAGNKEQIQVLYIIILLTNVYSLYL